MPLAEAKAPPLEVQIMIIRYAANWRVPLQSFHACSTGHWSNGAALSLMLQNFSCWIPAIFFMTSFSDLFFWHRDFRAEVFPIMEIKETFNNNQIKSFFPVHCSRWNEGWVPCQEDDQGNQDKSAPSFCWKVAAGSQKCFTTFLFKIRKIVNNLATTEAREK
jgi:hypothetical protein